MRTSVQRAIDGLDAFTLRILEALALLEARSGLSLAAVTELTGRLDPSDLHCALAELRALALVWGDDAHLHLVATVRDAIGPYPAGLGRTVATLLRQAPQTAASAAAQITDPQRLAELIAGCDPDELDVLQRLAAGPPVGTVRNARTRPVGEPSAPHRLIARGLLVPIDAQTVELPREVALALRDTPLGAVEPQPPEVAVTDREPAELDRLGTTAVLNVLRLVESLAASWTAHPPPLLRARGVGVRDLRRTGRDLGVDEASTALVIETAGAAGLLNATHGVDPVYLPTTEFDSWRRQTPAARWTALASAWLEMSRQPSLVGRRGERDRLITALGPDAERGTVPALRAQVLGALAELAPGAAPLERAQVLDRLAWYAPRRAAAQRGNAEALLAEADLLGVTAAGGLTGYSRTLINGSRAVAEQVLGNALPEPVDHFLVQPDLTIVVPGPPSAELGAELELAAELESTGGASVYRITEPSVRRALDAGRSGADLAALVAQRSRTPVPQALSYLIEDAARRHGRLRAGLAGAYLRSDDEALLARVLADRDVAELQLRRIAPSVVISPAPVARVLEKLRAAGYAPAAEAPGGEVLVLDAEAPRAPSRPPTRTLRARSAAEPGTQLSELIRRIRSGDALSQVSRQVPPLAHQVPGVTSAATMALLRDAIRGGRRVLLGCAEQDGTVSQHAISPISLGGGYVRGPDAVTQQLRAFPLHRITAAAVIDDDADEPA